MFNDLTRDSIANNFGLNYRQQKHKATRQVQAYEVVHIHMQANLILPL